jgi:hypothetical protein
MKLEAHNMSKLLRQNIGGTDYTMVGCTLTGVCNSAASDYVKSVTLSDGDVLSDGMTVVVSFTNGNTAGTAPASMTIYSSDQINYFSDSGLTQPFTLAPAGCYEITYTGEGNAYTYISYPVMQVGSVSGPLCDASGNKSSGSLWLAGDKVSITYSGGTFNVIPQTAGSLTVTAASSVVNGASVRVGSTVRVLFTQDITGAANTGLVLTYNGVSIPVMVGKNGSLGALLPFDVGGGTYKYLQAYTTLEMTYDGTQFIVLGNPVVISNSDYTVYTDGKITQRLSYTHNEIVNGLYSKQFNLNQLFNINFKNSQYGLRVTIISNLYASSVIYAYEATMMYLYPSYELGIQEIIPNEHITVDITDNILTISDNEQKTTLNIRIDLI